MKQLTTIMDDMVADVVINREDGKLTVLHDRPFDDELLEILYDEDDGTLLFRFRNKEQYFGATFFGEFADFIYDNEIVNVLQIDTEKNEAVGGMRIPLNIIE